jgi:hypothetical protein
VLEDLQGLGVNAFLPLADSPVMPEMGDADDSLAPMSVLDFRARRFEVRAE